MPSENVRKKAFYSSFFFFFSLTLQVSNPHSIPFFSFPFPFPFPFPHQIGKKKSVIIWLMGEMFQEVVLLGPKEKENLREEVKK